MCSCSESELGGLGITSFVLIVVLVTGGGSSVVVVFYSLAGPAVALTHKLLSIGITPRISRGGSESYGSSSQIIGPFAFFVE